jgi:hypothetical protein
MNRMVLFDLPQEFQQLAFHTAQSQDWFIRAFDAGQARHLAAT